MVRRAIQTPGGEPEPETSQPEAAGQSPEPAAGSLRAAAVDPTKLRRAVLTADGWVCPATSPAPPAKE